MYFLKNKVLKKNLRILSSLLTALLGIFVILFIIRYQNEEKVVPVVQVQPIEIVQPPQIVFEIEVDSLEIIEGKFKRNEFLANILLPYNVDYTTIDMLAKKSKEIFDVRKMAAGKKYTILIGKDSSKKAHYFIYQPNAIEYVIYDLRDSISIYKGEKEVEIQLKTVAGIINSSLYETLQDAKASPYLAMELADIFAWSIDFYRIQKGDWFKAIYEVKYVDNEAIGIGKVLAVEFNHYNNSFLGFFFDQGGKEDYFDEEANSLRKAFLKSPLKFSRLSSRYTMRRFHPVQKRWKAHLGTDYAAPNGTPIMSTGDGIIIESKYKRANGNYVKVKHNSAYTTQYLHMSKRNAKVGQKVNQGDVIGYVGSTGLATGPHVCYRFWKNGKQVDHLRQEFPSAEPILEEYKDAYEQRMLDFKSQLNSIQIEKAI